MPQDIQANRVLLSTAEARIVSGLGREYIQRLLRSGRLEGVKPGHDWLVYEDSLRAFLASPRKPGPKGPHKKAAPALPDGTADQRASGNRNVQANY